MPADMAHAMALKRARDAHTEAKALKLVVATKDKAIGDMALELARREVAALERQAAADARLDDLCARLAAGRDRHRRAAAEGGGCV